MRFKLFFLCLFCSLFSYGQVKDLIKMANGQLILWNPLYDSDDKLYGYFYLYERDANESEKKLEYILLDKNLNEVSNGEFSIKYKKNIIYRYDDCTLMDDKIILSKSYELNPAISFQTGSNYLANTFQIISLKDQTVSSEFIYKNGEIVKAPEDLTVLKAESKKSETKYIISAFSDQKNSGFYITQYNKNFRDYLEKEIVFFDKDCNFKWKYEYNPFGTLQNYRTFRFLHFKDSTLYISETLWKDNLASEYTIVSLNFNTGKQNYEYRFEYPKCEYIHRLKVKDINGNLYIVGDYVRQDEYLNFNYKKRLGFYRIILDSKGEEIKKDYNLWTEFTPEMGLNKKGLDKEKYCLMPKYYYIFNNGRISILTEKYRPENVVNIPIPFVNILVAAATYSPETTSDFLLMNFNQDFILSSVDTIHKDVTKYNQSDYLFSQYVKNDSVAIFFYTNKIKSSETNKASMILGINQLSDSIISEEKIPIYSKKEYNIAVLPAKEGYVMLREYNEKDKYNQIRLEKLNY